MSKIRKLAGETAIYGVSSILARILSYALTPLHTYAFPDTSEMGVVTGLYAYTAILLVIYTFGMETSFFRFANKTRQEDQVYNATSSAVIIVSLLLSSLIYFNATWFAEKAGYPEAVLLVKWLSIILFLDGLLAIPFARLRFQNKAKRFALAKVLNIVTNVTLQLCFLLLLPAIHEGELLPNLQPLISGWYNPDMGIGYIFLSNLIANIILVFLLFDLIAQIRLKMNWKLIKPLIYYSLPILIMGIAGMFNEQLDKILLEKILPDDFYPWDAVGVYGQTYKLAVFMLLAIQAFRYAGEPFFFSQAEDKHAPALFARVMHYFILFSLMIFVGVSLNVDFIAHFFLLNPNYRVALFLVPILLFGKLFYGIYVNLSIWFKLTDETIYGTYFTVAGAVITIVGNILLIPHIGYTGSAISMVLCYFFMCLICYYYGQKKYPIPYNFKKLIPHLLISVIIIWLSFLVKLENFWIDSLFNIVITLILFIVVYILEFKPLLRKA
jgi:O-antigen/teichoic acid export membrane protein